MKISPRLSSRASSALGTVRRDPWTTLYVDPDSGDDANDGAGADSALATLARAISLATSGDTIALARGSRFREALIGLPRGVKVRTYGAGERPIIDGREVADNGDFTQTDGRTNVYEISWMNDFGDPTGSKLQHRVWEDDEMLTRAASLAACDSTPGSFYAATPTGGPDTVYVHPRGSTNPASDGKEYTLSRRARCVQLYSEYMQADVDGIETIGNAHDDGSLCFDGVARDCIARDGVKHNVFAIGLAEDVQAIGIEDTGDWTMFISYQSDSFESPFGRHVVFRRCAALCAPTSGGSGFYSHTNNSKYFGTLQFEDCIVDGPGNAFGGIHADVFLFYRCATRNVLHTYAVAPVNTLVILGGEVEQKNANNGSAIQSSTSAGFSAIVHGVKSHKLGAGIGPLWLSSPNVDWTIERCTFSLTAGGANRLEAGTFRFRRNVVVGSNQHCIRVGTASGQVAELDVDQNCYWTSSVSNAAFNKQFGGAQSFNSFAPWQAYLESVALGVGRDVGSTAADPQLADPVNGDFTIGNATVLAMGAGAEVDEEDDPELQALWQQYRVS